MSESSCDNSDKEGSSVQEDSVVGDNPDNEGLVVQHEKIDIYVSKENHYFDSDGDESEDGDEDKKKRRKKRKVVDKELESDSEDDEDRKLLKLELKLKREVLVRSKNAHYKKVELQLPLKTAEYSYDDIDLEAYKYVFLSEAKRMEAIDLMKFFNGDKLRIYLEEEAYETGANTYLEDLDGDDPRRFQASLPMMNYETLLATCKNRKRVKIEFITSLTVEDWAKMRQDMWRDRVKSLESLESLDVYVSKDDANAFLREVFGYEFNIDQNGLKFSARGEGKTIDANKDRKTDTFSVHFFEGLFRTKIYAFSDNFDRFALRMEKIKNETKMKKLKKNYEPVNCLEVLYSERKEREEQKKAAKRTAADMSK